MDNKETVCAVVVTYNRKGLLIECLEALRKQTRPLEGIYIIDNASTDGTPELLEKKGYIKELPPNDLTEPWEKEFEVENLVDSNLIKIYYVRMPKNTGGAGGFHEGVKRAYERGYDWLWLMDDDGLPDKNALITLFKYIKKYKKNFQQEILAAVSCLVVSRDNYNKLAIRTPIIKDKYYKVFLKPKYVDKVKELRKVLNNNIYENWGYFFNAVLINTQAIRKAGYINAELFIWGDEKDYMYRLEKIGKIITVLDAIYYHPELKLDKNMPVWKRFYLMRNDIYLTLKYRRLKILRVIKTLFYNFKPFYRARALNQYFKAIFSAIKMFLFY